MLREEIGNILKAYREKLGQNQRTVAERAGISTSMLSQIERGAVSPSIDTLNTLCEALNLEMAALFSRVAPRQAYQRHRPKGRLKKRSGGVGYEQLAMSLNPSHPAEMFMLEVNAGGKTGMSHAGHEGVELGYVLEGAAVLCIDEQEVTLQAGDSISFGAHLAHRLENRGETRFRAIWSIQPPHTDYLE